MYGSSNPNPVASLTNSAAENSRQAQVSGANLDRLTHDDMTWRFFFGPDLYRRNNRNLQVRRGLDPLPLDLRRFFFVTPGWDGHLQSELPNAWG